MADTDTCKCVIGTHPEIEQINAALRAGQGLGTVAKPLGLVRGTLGKHRAKCLGIQVEPRPTAEATETPDGDGVETAETPPTATRQSRSRARVGSPQKSATTTNRAPVRDTSRGTAETPAANSVSRSPSGGSFPPRPDTREGRVVAVMNLMMGFRWERGATGPLLAAAWGMAPESIKDFANEASRRIKSVVDPTLVREKVCVALDRGLDMALAQEDVKGLASVAKAYTDILGAGASKRLELTGRDGVPLGLPSILAGLSPPPSLEELELFAQTGQLPQRPN